MEKESEVLSGSYPREYRAPLEELWRNMEHGAGGEYACCGVFQPRFTELLTRADDTLTVKTRKLTVKLI